MSEITGHNQRLIAHLKKFFPEADIRRDNSNPKYLCWDTFDAPYAHVICQALNDEAQKLELPVPIAHVGSPEHECHKVYSSGSAEEKPQSWVYLEDSALYARGPDIATNALALTMTRLSELRPSRKPAVRETGLIPVSEIARKMPGWAEFLEGREEDQGPARSKK